MNVVEHRIIRPDRHLRAPRRIGEHGEVEFEIAILEERPLAPVAALGDMMRQAGDDNSEVAGHGCGRSPIWGFTHLSL